MENDLLLRRMKELSMRASVRPDPQFTHFLDPTQLQAAIAAANAKGVHLATDGGYPDAERRIAAFYGAEPPVIFPYACVEIAWNARFGSPGHRDLLGSVMALGFERERMGDIVLSGEKAYLFAERDVASYVAANLERAGRVSVKCRVIDGAPELPPPEGRVVRETVPSLRLDALLSAGLDLSRSQASGLIAAKRVYLNHVETVRCDAPVEAGDVISVRGCGRIRLEEVGGLTRKGRLSVAIFRYAGT